MTLRRWIIRRASAHTRALALALALVMLATGIARADFGPDVAVDLQGPPGGALPVAGQPFTFDLAITSATTAVVESSALVSPRLAGGAYAWDTLSFPLPPSFGLVANQPSVFPVTLGCTDPSQPIEITLVVDGRTVHRRFHLLPQAMDAAIAGEATAVAADSGPTSMAKAAYTLPQPAPVARAAYRDLTDGKRSGEKAATRIITVHGRFVYRRDAHDGDFMPAGDGRTMGADGVTVRVWDEDWDADDLLAQAALGPDGQYAFSISYDQAEDPDLYVEFVAANTRVAVNRPALDAVPYQWRTATLADYLGSDLDLGTRQPGSADLYPALHQLATCTKAWRWLADDVGYVDMPQVFISWPDSDWPHYTGSLHTIFMPDFAEWGEGTVCHEYGHHWQRNHTTIGSSDYCNDAGRCDTPGEDCRHCRWCEESIQVAMTEGLPDWMSGAITDGFPGLYGFSALFPYDWESVAACGWNDMNVFDDPYQTEGAFAAFLTDLCDATNETDPNALPYGTDTLHWSPQRILTTQDVYDPTTALGFLNAVLARYASEGTDIWLAAANTRFDDVDHDPPTVVTGLTSTSHLTTGDSPDGTVDLVWNASTDALSGMAGYKVAITTPNLPTDLYNGFVTTNHWTTPNLGPGVYYFYVGSSDREGNSTGQPVFGPVFIRAWQPADLEANAGTWPYPIVPRLTSDATSTTANLPTLLIGNGNTYFNLRIRNTGEQATSPTLRLNLNVDGALWWFTNITTLDGFLSRAYLNLGPMTVRGGRHALGLFADANEQMSEPDEADNTYARQFVWYPPTLPTTNAWVAATRPSDAYGGVTQTLFTAANCDGWLYTPGTDAFIGAVMLADDAASDFDLRQHVHSTTPTSGFGLLDITASSDRPARCVEAVFANNAQTAETAFDVGVINPAYDAGGYRIRRVASTLMQPDTDTNVALNADAPLALRHVTLPGNSAGHGTVTLTSNPADGQVHVGVIPADRAFVGLDELAFQDATDSAGHARVDFSTTVSGPCAIVVWQDARSIPPGGSGHLAVTVRVFDQLADLAPLATAGWSAPLVPTTGAPGTAASTVLPPVLNGGALTTYLNAQFRNQAAGGAYLFFDTIAVDDVAVVTDNVFGVLGLSNFIRNFTAPQTVRGGRHTLSMFPDSGGNVAEGDETNNRYGKQYVWSPLGLATGPAIVRAAPPAATAGFAAVLEGTNDIAWYNCDGLRSPVPAPSGNTGQWLAVAALPGAASDVDLRLHLKSDSPTSGFAIAQAVSVAGPGQADYVLVNCRAVAPAAFDVGAVGQAGAESYRAQAVSSTWLGSQPAGAYGPFALGAGDLIALHEVWLPAGLRTIALADLGGDGVDWGLTLHRGQLPYHARTSTAGVVGREWAAGPGQGETLFVDVPQDGYYCLAVWKAGAADAGKAGTYRLTFSNGVAAVDGPGAQVPPVTALRDIAPNPFNPSTRITFDLAQAGPVRLEVYDLRGRLVRRLVAESRAAGRVEVVWDGRDEQGVAAASGTYVARLAAPGVVASRKMQLVK